MSEEDGIPTRRIIHEIKKSDELTEAKNLRDIAIMENLELRKNLLMVDFPDAVESIQNIETGIEFDLIKEKLENKPKRKTQTGQARLEPVRSKGADIYTAETHEQLISTIYDQLEEQKYYQDVGSKKFDAEKHRQLQGMSDKLLESCIKGEKLRGQTRNIYAWTCFRCKKTCVNTMTCPHCGYVNKSPSSVRGRVDYV